MYPPARSRFPHPSVVGVKHKKKMAPKPKPAWNDNINDLEAYKASPEEVAVKKESRKSKNVEVARVAMQEKAIEKRLKVRESRPPTASEKRQIAILREILHEQNQDELQDVLHQTDKALALVKDMFGDNPKKFHGLPEVTRAPNRGDTSSPDSLPRCPSLNASRMDDLSSRLMDKTALNDRPGHDDQGSDDDEDLQYLRAMDRKLRAKRLADTIQISPHKEPLKAMNDSGKILRSRPVFDNKENQDGRRSPELEVGKSRASGTEVGSFIKQLDDLKSVLSSLESELREYERVTGRSRVPSRRHDDSLTGCTSHMADILLTALRYMRQVDEEVRSERRRSVDLAGQLLDTRRLLDGMTADFLMMRDEFATYQAKVERQFAVIERAQHRSSLATVVMANPVTKATGVAMETPDESQPARGPVPVPSHVTQAAFLLSPPKQMDGTSYRPQPVAPSNPSHPSHPSHPSPHVHFSASTEAAQRHKSREPDPSSSQNLSDQIAELTREHEMAQARIARLQNLHTALDTATSMQSRAKDFDLKMPVFEDLNFGNEREDTSGSSTHHGIPSLPGDEEATPRSVASLPCDVEGMAALLGDTAGGPLLSDRDAIDQQIEELNREHEMTQNQMKKLQQMMAEAQECDRVSPAISPIPGQERISVHLPSAQHSP